MKLTELHISPPKPNTRENSEIVYELSRIIIKGISQPKAINSFVSYLGSESWARDIDITDYKVITGNDQVAFTVELSIMDK
jgi:hypothetical protein